MCLLGDRSSLNAQTAVLNASLHAEQSLGATSISRGMSAKSKAAKKVKVVHKKPKKIKIKPYGSFDKRFWLLKDGSFKRRKVGTRHNAHEKANKRRRQLSLPATVHSAYGTIMKKLNFKGS
ncbi:hypothetical protein CYMTET_37734 [Cymbomonas tetramitiformis]|uniref:50S ribosomal protein L35 n=1 Tax=Cymbomonas tetramitiformis TaxID=36881 RepID=A0AAE0CEP0_9CHLO|nr:hypothetical protein CYMTET_37734 [Cymbomonas tetramitiformis]